MKTASLVFAALMVTGMGCLRMKPSATTVPATSPSAMPSPVLTPTAKSGGGGSGGAVQAVRGAVNRTVNALEMHDLHLLIDTASGASGQMPSKEFILDAIKRENPKLYQMLQDGTIVLTGIKVREGVWAYEKDAPTKGGWILTQSGEERLSADEVKKRLANQ